MYRKEYIVITIVPPAQSISNGIDGFLNNGVYYQHMKGILAATTLFGIVLVAVFGFTTMGHADEHGLTHRGCVASEAQGMTCPATGNPFDTAIFHLDVLKSITMGVLPVSVMLGLLAGSLGALLLSLFAQAGHPYELALSRFGFIPAVRSPVPRARERLITWLTLYEKRDPALAS